MVWFGGGRLDQAQQSAHPWGVVCQSDDLSCSNLSPEKLADAAQQLLGGLNYFKQLFDIQQKGKGIDTAHPPPVAAKRQTQNVLGSQTLISPTGRSLCLSTATKVTRSTALNEGSYHEAMALYPYRVLKEILV